MTRSSVHGFPQNAIVGENADVVHADGCEFWDASSAIAVTGRSTATVTGSKFRDLRGNGVYVGEAATAAISAATFVGTIYPAVAVVGEGSAAELESCLIEKCGVKWPGLWVDDAATATIRATRVQECSPAILARRQTNYSPDELTAIFTARCHEADLELSADAAAAARELFARLHARRDAHFGNGRVARTQFETVIERQAARLTDDVQASTRVITAADIPTVA